VIHSTDFVRRVGKSAARRWPWLVAVVGGTALVSVVVGAVLGWLSPAVGTPGALAFTLVLWAALAGVGVAVTVLLDLRPAWRITLATLGAVAALLLCGVPAGALWTFGVDYGEPGAVCPECAVTTYLSAAPFAAFAHDDLRFDRVLCDARRGELRRQADAMAHDVQAVGETWRKVSSADERVTAEGDRATVTARVSLDVGVDGTRSVGVTTWRYEWGAWTFSLVEDAGWQVCGVDAPQLCGEILNCEGSTPTPSASPTEEDLLQHPREMLPCGPRDPLRERRRCPPTPGATPR
jgi:hypothetical protein